MYRMDCSLTVADLAPVEILTLLLAGLPRHLLALLLGNLLALLTRDVTALLFGNIIALLLLDSGA